MAWVEQAGRPGAQAHRCAFMLGTEPDGAGCGCAVVRAVRSEFRHEETASAR